MRTQAIIVVLIFLISSISSAQTGPQKVLYSFTGGVDGGQPYAGVIFDPAGNLYGVTQYGGAYGQGTVFQLTPSPEGTTWTETVRHSFSGGEDGSQPLGGLVTDGVGNFYGTASLGGTNNDGCGTLFQLNNSWNFGVLHTFNDLTGDGCQPQADLSFADPDIIGTTVYGGGPTEQGTVFTSGPGYYDRWPFQGNNGTYPNGAVPFWGSIYGTTQNGGGQGRGDVFEAVGWGIEVKHVFSSTGKESHLPVGDLVTQVNANGVQIMYGVTASGGAGGYGTVYQLTENPNYADVWDISVLYSFSRSDGFPEAGLVLDPAGNLYGTTYGAYGGSGPGYAGTVYKLTPGARNKWTHTVLYSFTGGTDGGHPWSTVVLDSAGNLYGTTPSGGAYNQGVVYEVYAAADVEPTTLTFGPQRLNTTSPAKRISLFNHSPVPISVSSVNLEGDFAVSANKCQNGVKPNTHCDVYVTFTPTGTGTGPRTGTITFVDTASNSPQLALLSGTVGVSETSVTTSGLPSFVGQPVTFTAAVSSASGTPTGTVIFYDSSSALGSVTLANGSASLSTSSLTAGSHSITAAYQGSGSFAPSTSAPLNQVVNPATSTTSLVSSANPARIKQSVTYTATVASLNGGAITGTVAFQDGGRTVATVTIVDSQAAYSTKYNSPGTHSIAATYSGDTTNTGSISPALVEQINRVFPSKTVVTTSGSPSFVDQPVTFTATVTSTHGTIPDGELVTFYDNTTAIGTSATASGVATFVTSSLTARTHIIKAAYAGDATFEVSTGSVKQIVDNYPTTTTLNSSLNPSNYGQAVTFTATVTSAGPTPTGKVTFMDGTKGLGSPTLSGGVATLTTSKLAVGTHPITAEYLGDADSAKSTSAVLDQVVE